MSSPRCTHFRPALPEDYIIPEDEQQQPAICNVMVMELCDLGNLRRALEKGLLHKPVVESRRIVVDMELLLEVRFRAIFHDIHFVVLNLNRIYMFFNSIISVFMRDFLVYVYMLLHCFTLYACNVCTCSITSCWCHHP